LKAANVSGSNVYKLAGNVFEKRTAATGQIAANSAYYTADSEADRLALAKGVETGITETVAEDGKAVKLYDLNGRETTAPVRGIYVTSDGKKVFVK
ncbi:MAG: hypothetical protein IJC92_04870, partial [Bacteroidaceae bacterium]|nr:hypothetical protein [Bacteroidaceae bacterium]